MRAAIYYTPPAEDPLTRAAALWLGRCAFGGGPTRAPDPAIDPLVGAPARYGFHATMMAPFRLSARLSLPDLDMALAAFCAQTPPVDLGRLRLAPLAGFLALRPEREAGVAALEARLRPALDGCRAPIAADDIARRDPDRLTPRQRENLHRWGYPHVGPDYRFHMTLTDRLDDPAPAEAELSRRLSPLLEAPRRIDALTIFVEPVPRGPFLVHGGHRLTG